MSRPADRPTAFISYAREKLDAAQRLYDDLKRAGVDPWLDVKSLRGGAPISATIKRAIKSCRYFIVLLSAESVKVSYVNRELREALERLGDFPETDVYLIPVRLEDVQPAQEALENLNWINMFPSWDDGLREILISIFGENAPSGGEEKSSEPEIFVFKEREFVRIPAGPFLMGSEESRARELNAAYRTDSFSLEMPRRETSVAEFYIARYPVTNSEYQQFINEVADQPIPFRDDAFSSRFNWNQQTRTHPEGMESHPVVLVSWHDAQKYCRWLGGRLPNEAEWEKAARGTDGREWPWGNAWELGRCNTGESNWGTTTPVEEYADLGDSPFGVRDMAGNVWEWCSSLLLPYPYRADSRREAVSGEGRRVIRGGPWDNGKDYARCAVRGGTLPGDFGANVGFRVALDRQQ
jgi:formylglycine-generating enzyme required for sulfatase activity